MTIKVLNALIQSGKRHQNSVNPYKMANTENEYFFKLFTCTIFKQVGWGNQHKYDTQARLISQECWERCKTHPRRSASHPPRRTPLLPPPTLSSSCRAPTHSLYLFTIQGGGRNGLPAIYFATIKILKEKGTRLLHGSIAQSIE